MIPLAVPNLSGNEKKYLNDCIDTTFVSSVGEYVKKMEEMVRKATDSYAAVCTSSGTTGLHAALTAIGVKHGDLVILPTFTFIATANAVAHCGAEPWLMDISENDWCMNPTLVEKELQKNCEKRAGDVIHVSTGCRVAALMPVYTLGNIPDMEKFRAIADKWGLSLVADAACAIGAEYLDDYDKKKQIGKLADLSVLSFNGNKTITCGGGGAVVGADEEQLSHVRHLTTTARVWPDYDFDEVGFNYRMTNIQAAVGVAQMERLDEFIEKKRAVRRVYEENLSDIEGITFFPTTQGSSCWFSGIVLKPGTKLGQVKKITTTLKDKGVEARPFWKPMHLQKPYENCPKSEMTIADSLWERIITLPCSTNITDTQLEIVNKNVHEIFT